MSVKRTGIVVVDPLDFISTSRLKRDLLLVDELALDPASLDAPRAYAEFLCSVRGIESKTCFQTFDALLRDLEKAGRLRELSLQQPTTADQAKVIQQAEQKADEALREAARRGKPYPVQLQDGTTTLIDPVGTAQLYFARAHFLRARVSATQLSTLSNIFLALGSGKFNSIFPADEGSGTVLQVVLHNFPVPDDATSLETILEFGEDQKTMESLSLLRGWMADIAKGTSTPQALQDKIDSQLTQYAQHMRYHGIKASTGVFETVMTTIVGAVGDAVRLQWGDAVKRIFDVLKSKTQLTEAELKAPGRELAYLSAAKARFGTSQGRHKR